MNCKDLKGVVRNTTPTYVDGSLVFSDIITSNVVGWDHFISTGYIIVKTESGTIYICGKPTSKMPVMNKVQFRWWSKQYETSLNDRTKQLYISDGTLTSKVVARGKLLDYHVAMTVSGNVYITSHPTLIYR